MFLRRFQDDQHFRETHKKLNFYRYMNLYNNEYNSYLLLFKLTILLQYYLK